MLKAIFLDLICEFCWMSGASKPRRFAKNKLTAVTFHRVLQPEQRKYYPYPGLAVTPEELSWILKQFSQYFECGPFTSTYQQWLEQKSGKKPYLAITFDDGQLDNYVNARPVLDALNLKATFYVPIQHINDQKLIWHDRLGFAAKACFANGCPSPALTAIVSKYNVGTVDQNNFINDIVEKTKNLDWATRNQFLQEVEKISQAPAPGWADMMSWEMIKQLSKEGHEIGSHTMTHAMIPQLSDDELTWEIAESRLQLEKQIGLSIKSFCYPNGDNDARTREAVKAAGYENAVTTQWGLNEFDVAPHALYRCDLDTRRLLNRSKKLSRAHLFFRLGGLHPGLR